MQIYAAKQRYCAWRLRNVIIIIIIIMVSESGTAIQTE